MASATPTADARKRDRCAPTGRAPLRRGRVEKRTCIVSVESRGLGPDGAGPSLGNRNLRSLIRDCVLERVKERGCLNSLWFSCEYIFFCIVRLPGRGRPPGGPSWVILSHGPPGGRALPEEASDKKSQGFRLATPLSRHHSHCAVARKRGPPRGRAPVALPRDLVAGNRHGRCGFQPRHVLGHVAQDLLNKHRATSGGAASSRAAG